MKFKETATVCPKCRSSNVVSEWLPPSFSITCSDCKWSALTSRFPPIFEDQKIYKVFLVPRNSDPLHAITAIKTYKGATSTEAKKLAKANQVFLVQGYAIDIFRELKWLSEKKVKVRIEPEFNYTDADLMGMKIS